MTRSHEHRKCPRTQKFWLQEFSKWICPCEIWPEVEVEMLQLLRGHLHKVSIPWIVSNSYDIPWIAASQMTLLLSTRTTISAEIAVISNNNNTSCNEKVTESLADPLCKMLTLLGIKTCLVHWRHEVKHCDSFKHPTSVQLKKGFSMPETLRWFLFSLFNWKKLPWAGCVVVSCGVPLPLFMLQKKKRPKFYFYQRKSIYW